MVECRTPEREVGGSRPTAAVLCPWARHFTPRKYWLITQEAVAPSRRDWKIVDWDVKPQHKQTIILSRQQITKMTIRLCGCTGWSVSSFFAYDINRFPHNKSQFQNIFLTYSRITIWINRKKCEQKVSLFCLILWYSEQNQSNYPIGRTSVLAVGGHGLKPWSRHTKFI